jgi:hypothetical protein
MVGSSWEQLNDPTEAKVSALIIFLKFGLLEKICHQQSKTIVFTLGASRQMAVPL